MSPKINKETIDFKSLHQELETINKWFDTQNIVDPSEALEKYRRSVEIVKTMKSHLVEVENEFQAITKSLEDE